MPLCHRQQRQGKHTNLLHRTSNRDSNTPLPSTDRRRQACERLEQRTRTLSERYAHRWQPRLPMLPHTLAPMPMRMLLLLLVAVNASFRLWMKSCVLSLIVIRKFSKGAEAEPNFDQMTPEEIELYLVMQASMNDK